MPTTDDSDVPDNPFSPISPNAHDVLIQSNDAIDQSTSDPDSIKVISGSPGKNMVKSDDEPEVGRLSPSGEPLRSRPQPSSVPTPSNTSLLSYEFSNVRVRPATTHVPCLLSNCPTM